MVFKALIDCAQQPNAYEREYLRVHLNESISDECATSLAKGLSF